VTIPITETLDRMLTVLLKEKKCSACSEKNTSTST